MSEQIKNIFHILITDAIGLRIVQNEAFVTGAHKTAERIGTMSVLTDVLVFLALVDVLKDDGYAIRPVTRSARTQLLVFLRAGLGTLLATIAPGSADAAATGRLRHRRRHLEDTLRSSGAVLVTREAQRFTSICVRQIGQEL